MTGAPEGTRLRLVLCCLIEDVVEWASRLNFRPLDRPRRVEHDVAVKDVDDRIRSLLRQMKQELIGKLPWEEPESALYHYTSPKGFLGILQSGGIWATDFRTLNDTDELKIGDAAILEAIHDLCSETSENTLEGHLFRALAEVQPGYSLTQREEVFICSFSERRDLLSQWRAYGGRGFGYAIGFDAVRPPDNPDAPPKAMLWLVKCDYDRGQFKARARQELRGVAEGFAKYVGTYATTESDAGKFCTCAIDLSLRRAAGVVPRLKHPAFAEEQEWRLICVPVRDVDLDIAEVEPEQVTSNRRPADSLLECHATESGVVTYLKIPLAREGELMNIVDVVAGPCQAAVGVPMLERVLRLHGYSADLASRSEAPYRG